MKKVIIADLPAILKAYNVKVEDDGDDNDLRLHSSESYRWSADNKKDYDTCAANIDAIKFKGKGWEIYAWCDISGFDYWVVKQEETNYIQLTIAFDEDTIESSEIEGVVKAMKNAEDMAEFLQETYNYDPQYKN